MMGKCMTVKVYIENYHHKRVHIATVNTDEGKSQKVTITSELIPEFFSPAAKLKLADAASNQNKKKNSTKNVTNNGIVEQQTYNSSAICDDLMDSNQNIPTIGTSQCSKFANFNLEPCVVDDSDLNHRNALVSDGTNFVRPANMCIEECNDSVLLKETEFEVEDFLNEMGDRGHFRRNVDNNLQQLMNNSTPVEIESESNDEESDCDTNLEEYFIVDKLIGTRFNEKIKKKEYLLKPKRCSPKNILWNPISETENCDISLFEHGRLYMQAPKSLKLTKKKSRRRTILMDKFLSGGNESENNTKGGNPVAFRQVGVVKQNINLDNTIDNAEKVSDQLSDIHVDLGDPVDELYNDSPYVGIPRMASFDDVELMEHLRDAELSYNENESNVKKRIKSTISNTGSFSVKCEYCPFGTKNLTTLKLHTESHLGKFMCPTCGKTFGNSRFLTNHCAQHENLEVNRKKPKRLERGKKRQVEKWDNGEYSSDMSDLSNENSIKSGSNRNHRGKRLKKKMGYSKVSKTVREERRLKRGRPKKRNVTKSVNETTDFSYLPEPTVALPKLILDKSVEKFIVKRCASSFKITDADPDGNTCSEFPEDDLENVTIECNIRQIEEASLMNEDSIPVPSTSDLLVDINVQKKRENKDDQDFGDQPAEIKSNIPDVEIEDKEDTKIKYLTTLKRPVEGASDANEEKHSFYESTKLPQVFDGSLNVGNEFQVMNPDAQGFVRTASASSTHQFDIPKSSELTPYREYCRNSNDEIVQDIISISSSEDSNLTKIASRNVVIRKSRSMKRIRDEANSSPEPEDRNDEDFIPNSQLHKLTKLARNRSSLTKRVYIPRSNRNSFSSLLEQKETNEILIEERPPLLRRNQINTGKQIRCSVCGILCRNKLEFKNHNKYYHRRNIKACDFCHMEFSIDEKLMKHCIEYHKPLVVLERI